MGPREGLELPGFWPARRDPTGTEGPTPTQTRSRNWRRVGPNAWVPADVESTPTQRVIEAAARLPAYGAVTGWGAFHIAGARWFEGGQPGSERPVPLALGPEKSLRPGMGYVLSQEILRPQEIARLRGVRVTTALRSVTYEMRKATTDEEALVAFEMAAYDDFVSVVELARYIPEQTWIRQGVERLRRLLPELEENSWSPMETLMRHCWVHEAGLPRPMANRPVFDLNGRFIGTPDLLEPDLGVFALYDGSLHLAGAQRHADVVKYAAYTRLGLEGVTMMAGDLGNRRAFVSRLRDAARRASRTPASARAWAPAPPAWWQPTHTVALRRALSAEEQDRLLGYRHVA